MSERGDMAKRAVVSVATTKRNLDILGLVSLLLE